jgi:uncharacterized protein (TIGR04141 family)
VPPTLQRLHVRLLKPAFQGANAALEDPDSLSVYDFKSGLGFSGRLYVSPPNQGPPRWLKFVNTGIEGTLKEITNRTNAAVLLLKRKKRVFAITFGHGRHLLNEKAEESDFGLKGALNALRHDSLRSVDSFAIEEQTVHKRSQASRASGLEVFGIDVSHDIMRAVTGIPRANVALQAVAGTGGTLSISAHTDFRGLGPLTDLLISLYRKRSYREHFAWVDNVRRVTDLGIVEQLQSNLVEDLKKPAPRSYLAPPEPLEWDSVHEFGYTHRRNNRDVDMTLASWLQNIAEDALTVETIQNNKVFAYGEDEDEPWKKWSIYDCLVFETSHAGRRFVLTAGEWFEIDRNLAEQVGRVVRGITKAKLSLPSVLVKQDGSLETEPDYNQRVVEENDSMALLDRKSARCRGTASGIEVCDLLSKDNDLIHVKHRKGGSSSLSHLFAQARMSAEALLRDADFRRDARRLLREIRPSLQARIPTAKPDPKDYRVVFAILGSDPDDPGEGLPFFSQLNLVRSYEALGALGYRVGVIGVPAGAA